jgi:hypothetical protein
MIPPALTQKKWIFVSVAILPLALIGISAKEQVAQAARQSNTTYQSDTLPNGVYLYGNSPQPNQLLHNYVVFEQQNGQVVGAFYSPQSEFTCFAGDVQGTRLDVAAIDPEQPPYEVNAQLSQLNALPTISKNDQRILSTCKQATISLAPRESSVD